MRTAVNKIPRTLHILQIPVGKIVITPVLGCLVKRRIVVSRITVLPDIIRHQLWKNRREIHPDTAVLHDVAGVSAKGHDVVDIEIPPVQPLLLIFRFYRTADHGTVDAVIVVITPVQVNLQALVARHVRIFPYRKLFHLHHRTGQHRLIPVFRIHQSGLYADVVQWSQVIPPLHVTVEDMVSHKTVQRVFAVFQPLKAMVFGIFIFRINRIIYLTRLIVKPLDVTGHDSVSPRQYRVRNDEQRKPVTFLIRNGSRLLVDMGSVIITFIQIRIPRIVTKDIERVQQSRGLQSCIERRNLIVLLQHLRQHPVGVFQHFRYGLHDSVLYRVVLKFENDMGSLVDHNHGVPVFIITMPYL